MEKAAHLMLIASFVSTFLIEGCWSLRDVKLEIPDYVRRGRDVRLRCKYDLEKDALYAIKWYKGFQEFYRYIPKEVPPEKVFPLPGISVDVTVSNEHQLMLVNTSQETSGNYKCVVSAESPFQTLSASADLTALVIGDDRPYIQLDRSQSQYHPGDIVTVHCRAPPSHPPANITWYLNDDKVTEDVVGQIKTETETTSHQLESGSSGSIDSALTKRSRSVIEFDLSENVTPVRIKCRAHVFTAYDKNSTTLTIQPVPRRLSGPDTLLRSHGVRISPFMPFPWNWWQPPTVVAFIVTFYFVHYAQWIS